MATVFSGRELAMANGASKSLVVRELEAMFQVCRIVLYKVRSSYQGITPQAPRVEPKVPKGIPWQQGLSLCNNRVNQCYNNRENHRNGNLLKECPHERARLGQQSTVMVTFLYLRCPTNTLRILSEIVMHRRFENWRFVGMI